MRQFTQAVHRLRAMRPLITGCTQSSFLLILAVCWSAQANDRLLQPKDIARFRTVTDVAVSPDGQWFAYNVSVPRQPLTDEDGPAWSELHVTNFRGNSRPFITGKVNIGAAQWLPDSSAILYLARRTPEDKHTALYRIPIDGGESQRVLSHTTAIQDFAISQDGERLAFLAKESLPLPTEEIREKGFNQEVYEEDWRPTKVWIADLDDPASPRALDLPGSASAVAWSPSGHELAVALAPTSLVDDSYMARRVHIVDVDGGSITQRINNPGKLGQIGFSPDGEHLALISGADVHDPREGRLMIATLSGDGSLRDLLPDYQAHVSTFIWKDSATLTWLADEGTETRIGTVSLSGESATRLDPEGMIVEQLSLSQDGSITGFVAHSPTHGPELFALRGNSTEPRRLSHVNPWLEEIRWARQESVRWTARDGLELQGILIYPLNYVEGRRYPLIVTVHGGPEAHEANGWLTSYSRPGQVAAARGFAVFYPNYRGSTGRGVEFSKLGQADAAGKEFDDLVDGVDHLIQMGLVDQKRVGITGGSYGGYASAWGATYYSERFAASVMFVGISDNVSKLGTTDIPEEMYLVHHRKRLWEDWDYFLQRSPIRHVQKNQTPTLILHGKSDPRVHPSQSLELYRHLKTLQQAPVRLVLYEGEGHGNRKAAARLDYHLRMLRWMEHYLQGPGGEPPAMEVDYDEAMAP